MMYKEHCDTYGSEFDIIREAMPEEFAEAEELCMLRSEGNFLHCCLSPVEPVLLSWSTIFIPRPKDWPKAIDEAVTMTGYWVVDRQAQEARMGMLDERFGGASLHVLREFLGRGPAPVYMGWGSMTAMSPASMSCLAVRSLKRAGMRGVVLSGWAGLSADLAEGEKDASELKAYAADNVLFMDTAPHEWLFPQCAVIVHHGGSGTTAAALRSGTPSVITPVWGDQFTHAWLLKKSRCGVGAGQLRKMTDRVLGNAIKKCATDVGMQKRAASLGEKLRQEDGPGNAARVIDQFFTEQVATGEWARKRAEHLRAAVAPQAAAPGSQKKHATPVCCCLPCR